MTREELLEIGFKNLPHAAIGAPVDYDLGRYRYLSVGSVGTPNEMVFIYEIDDKDPKKITDLVVLKNYDYDGLTEIETIKSLISLLTCQKKNLSKKQS